MSLVFLGELSYPWYPMYPRILIKNVSVFSGRALVSFVSLVSLVSPYPHSFQAAWSLIFVLYPLQRVWYPCILVFPLKNVSGFSGRALVSFVSLVSPYPHGFQAAWSLIFVLYPLQRVWYPCILVFPCKNVSGFSGRFLSWKPNRGPCIPLSWFTCNMPVLLL